MRISPTTRSVISLLFVASLSLGGIAFLAREGLKTYHDTNDALQNAASPDASLAAPKAGAHESDQVFRARVREAYGKLPLTFEANRGQTDSRVKFLSRGSGYTLFLTSTEAVLRLAKPKSKIDQTPEEKVGASKPEAIFSNVLRMQLVGANSEARVLGREEQPGKVNYFMGNDPKQWHADVPTYFRVEYQEVYPGVDLVYYGNQGQLEYDFVVAPRADPESIKLAFQGVVDLEINPEGDLILHTASGDVIQHAPLIYQTKDAAKQAIRGHYTLQGPQQVGFRVGNYDRSRPLIIDPMLSYSTYLGGSAEDAGFSIAVDSLGLAYVMGWTFSTNFPTASPSPTHPYRATNGGGRDVFVAKLNATGNNLVYSTYLGGSADDYGWGGIAVDSAGLAYITGSTDSTNFPTANAFQPANAGGRDAFVTKLSAQGNSLAYSTYLGGNGEDMSFDIAVDSAGLAYVTGRTFSTNFPTSMNPFQAMNRGQSDAFVTKFNAMGNALAYSTYLGGTLQDTGFGIAVDSAGLAYVTGWTFSTNFPTTASPFQAMNRGGNEAFVTKLNAMGNSLAYSTYLGGTLDDVGYDIAVDSAGLAYVSGRTLSTNFPTSMNPFQAMNRGQGDGFVTKLNAQGNALAYSTYLGGTGSDFAYGIAVDSAGLPYVTGWTDSTNFPTSNPLQPNNGGQSDAFVTKFSATGNTLAYSTYFGGTGNDSGYGIAVDSAGLAYVTGLTQSTNFPTANPFQAMNRGQGDGFVAKLN